MRNSLSLFTESDREQFLNNQIKLKEDTNNREEEVVTDYRFGIGTSHNGLGWLCQ